MNDKYAEYVEHPRFGRSPRITGLNPQSDLTTGKPFLHWNATERIPNTAVEEADCVRCVPCRKRQQGIALKRERYEELFHIVDRTADENLEMAECCLSLIEEGVFHVRQAQHVRELLKRVDAQGVMTAFSNDLSRRLALLP